MTLAYEGIRIIDLTRTLAGPYATMILADLGAEVIKIESAAGDDARRLPPYHNETGVAFLAANRNKKSVVLDLKSERGREAVCRLAAGADIVVESFRPGVSDRLGIGFVDLIRYNTRLIHCSISAFGTGALGGELPGYEPLIQAFSGIMKATGHPGQPPVRVGPSVVDLTTGMWAAMQMMAALARRGKSEGPQRLEVALVDSALNLMCHQVLGYLATGVVPEPLGSGSPLVAPYEVFAALDGDIMIAAGNDALYRTLCRHLGRPDLIDHPDYRDANSRVANRQTLHAAIGEILKTATVECWTRRFLAAGVPAGPVQDLGQALRHPVVAERGLLTEPSAPDCAALPMLRLPLSGARQTFVAPPELGQDTDGVLLDIGLED